MTLCRINFELQSSSCFFIIIGGKYLNRIKEVLDYFNKKPVAVFLYTHNNENVNIDIDSNIHRQKLTPVMVK